MCGRHSVVWEASDSICGYRLKAALPSMVESLERQGHFDLDPDMRQRVFAASAATIDRLLKAIREQAGKSIRVKCQAGSARRDRVLLLCSFTQGVRRRATALSCSSSFRATAVTATLPGLPRFRRR